MIVPASGSGIYPDYAGGFWITDGNLGTLQFFGSYGTRSYWFSIDLGRDQEVGHIVMYADLSKSPSFLLNTEFRIGLEKITIGSDTSAIPRNTLVCMGSVFEGRISSNQQVFEIIIEPPIRGRWITVQDMKPGPGGEGRSHRHI